MNVKYYAITTGSIPIEIAIERDTQSCTLHTFITVSVKRSICTQINLTKGSNFYNEPLHPISCETWLWRDAVLEKVVIH